MSPRRTATEGRPMRRALALALGAALLSCSIACLTFLEISHSQAATTHPSPTSEMPYSDEDEFPYVDWDYWLEINPDIIGWVTVPGNAVDYPIVQAPPDDPQYYLWHDVYGDWNFMGCPYLDADCTATGLFGSRNAVISAHNLGHGDSSLFAAFANYTDKKFALGHSRILLQSPNNKPTLEFGFASRHRGDSPAKRTEFESDADFRQWLQTSINEADTVIFEPAALRNSVFTFITCSYTIRNDERMVIYATTA